MCAHVSDKHCSLYIFRYVGQRNLIYILFVLALWKATGVYEVFFALTSFVHYFRY